MDQEKFQNLFRQESTSRPTISISKRINLKRMKSSSKCKIFTKVYFTLSLKDNPILLSFEECFPGLEIDSNIAKNLEAKAKNGPFCVFAVSQMKTPHSDRYYFDELIEANEVNASPTTELYQCGEYPLLCYNIRDNNVSGVEDIIAKFHHNLYNGEVLDEAMLRDSVQTKIGTKSLSGLDIIYLNCFRIVLKYQGFSSSSIKAFLHAPNSNLSLQQISFPAKFISSGLTM